MIDDRTDNNDSMAQRWDRDTRPINKGELI